MDPLLVKAVIWRESSFDTNKIGRVTSGTLSPTSGKPIGIAYVDKDYAAIGTEVYLDIRGRGARARVVETPFVQTELTKK